MAGRKKTPHPPDRPLVDQLDQLSHEALKAIKRMGRLTLPRVRRTRLGGMPGIEPHELSQIASDGRQARITCIDYCKDNVQFQEVTVNLDNFLAQHRPEWSQVRWINVDGIGDIRTIQSLATKYHLHPLAIEDVLHIPQRPKVEYYEGENNEHSRIFIIARMAQIIEGRLHSEQVSIFLGRNTVLTFQETRNGDVWEPVRERIRKPGSRLRLNDASFLMYSLIDAVVDHFYPILEHYGNHLEALEDSVFEDPNQQTSHEIHELRRQLLLIRRDIWPTRELVQVLQRDPHDCIGDNTRTYLRDVYDHAVQIIDLLETYREVASGLMDIYMSAMSHRLNEVIKVLTIMGTIFIPLTFLAGVYGMNFHVLPELQWKYAYPMFWVICLVIAGGMITWFRRRGWI